MSDKTERMVMESVLAHAEAENKGAGEDRWARREAVEKLADRYGLSRDRLPWAGEIRSVLVQAGQVTVDQDDMDVIHVQ